MLNMVKQSATLLGFCFDLQEEMSNNLECPLQYSQHCSRMPSMNYEYVQFVNPIM